MQDLLTSGAFPELWALVRKLSPNLRIRSAGLLAQFTALLSLTDDPEFEHVLFAGT